MDVTKTPTSTWRPRVTTKEPQPLEESLPTLSYEPRTGITLERDGNVETITIATSTTQPLFLTTHHARDHSWQVRIIVQPGAHAILLHDLKMEQRRGAVTLDINVARGGSLCHAIIQQGGILAVETYSTVAAEARVERFLLSNGETSLREENRLAGEAAELLSNHLYLAPATSSVTINHEAPGTRSRLHARGVTSEQTILEGALHIMPTADGSDAHQELHALLTTRSASAKTSPRLFIGTDNVKCSHAATTSTYDAEETYYLASRGLDEEELQTLLLRAFATPILPHTRYCLHPFLEKLLNAKRVKQSRRIAETLSTYPKPSQTTPNSPRLPRTLQNPNLKNP